MKRCHWGCGRKAENRSGICDDCWKAAELRRSASDEGYKAWLEWKSAKQPKQPRGMSDAQRQALGAARGAKLLKQLPTAVAN